MQSWLEEIWVGKGAKQQGWLQAWEYCQAKLSQTLVRAQGVDWSWSQCIKSHHAQTSSGKGLLSHFWTRDNVRSVLPGLWRKRTRWSKVLFSDESKFCISFGNQGPRVWRKSGEAQNPCCLRSSVKFPQSVMIWAAMSSAGVVHCVFWVHSQRSHLPGNFRALPCFLLLTSFMEMLISFPAGLGTCPHCQGYQKLVQWPWCYCAWLASKLAWPDPHRESIGYCQEEDERHQTQQCRWAEGHCQRNLGFHTTSAVPQTDHLHATPNLGSN